jgi:hypothetical protein
MQLHAPKPVSIVPAGFNRPSDIYSSLSVLFCELEIMANANWLWQWFRIIQTASEAFYPHKPFKERPLSLVGKGNDHTIPASGWDPAGQLKVSEIMGTFFSCLRSLQGVGVSVGDQGVGVTYQTQSLALVLCKATFKRIQTNTRLWPSLRPYLPGPHLCRARRARVALQ